MLRGEFNFSSAAGTCYKLAQWSAVCAIVKCESVVGAILQPGKFCQCLLQIFTYANKSSDPRLLGLSSPLTLSLVKIVW